MPKDETATQAFNRARKRLRKTLHDILDQNLNGTTEEGGQTVKVIDSMTFRALSGCGFNIRVHALHPSETRAEAPATITAGPAVRLMGRDEIVPPQEDTDAEEEAQTPEQGGEASGASGAGSRDAGSAPGEGRGVPGEPSGSSLGADSGEPADTGGA